jgi:hypothetical protein
MKNLLSTVSAILLLAGAGPGRAQQPPTSLTISVPDYKVAKGADVDIVTIPDGSLLTAEEGRPLVPYFYKDVEYPAGYRVQAVTMKQRSEPRVDSGIRLGFVQIDTARLPESSKKLTPYPEKDFDWRVWDNPDGSSRLVVLVYPFRYEPKTTRVRFFKEYGLDVSYIKTDARIRGLDLGGVAFEPGAEVKATVLVDNPAPGMAAALAIHRAFDDRLVKELPAVKLDRDSEVVSWRAGTTPPGQYVMVAQLKDAAGNVLDREKTAFRIGSPAGEVTDFTVEPQHFKPGDTLRLVLQFKNTGNCEIEGEYAFRVMTADSLVREFTEPLAALKPGRAATARKSLATAGLGRGAVYYAIGFVQYDGGSSQPRSAMFSTNLMPVAVFSVTPDTVRVGDEVTFDASASADSDGSIATYRWEFGDGGAADGATAVRRYHDGGEYRVKLTVTDNENGQAEAERVLAVEE